jgi:hypothetical protein
MIPEKILDIEKRYFTQRVKFISEKDKPITLDELSLYFRYLKIENEYDYMQKRVIFYKESLRVYQMLVRYIERMTPQTLGKEYEIGWHNRLGCLLLKNRYFQVFINTNNPSFIFNIGMFEKEIMDIHINALDWKNYRFIPSATGLILMLNHLFGNLFDLRLEIKQKGQETMEEIVQEKVMIIPISREYYKKYIFDEYEKDRYIFYEYEIYPDPMPFNYFIYEWYASDGIFNITSDRNLHNQVIRDIIKSRKRQ